ncbi:glycosyltransferase family 4 protein [Pseudoalteromonas sp. OANN1]|uniref:glycosyltransferase family 4 protein n=1 Tax=Pseudoalteromonas sp. OANN1 TaxID=2954497 RepID=UPI00209750E6|nr:glycosyltransferase family 4 protein [Pseudoalteromonas sp. OANN1]MCO7198258.1 glycosyltransferase family 4 protein [Pseudoalteromonas sp. OANN1]
MRILFVSQLFDPEYSIKGLELMKYWVSQGHEVEVITTFPNYPTGKVFDGYKMSTKQVEVIDGVRIIRLWSHVSHSKSKLSRAFSYLSFTFMALIECLKKKDVDLLYTYHPQSTTGLIGLLFKYFKKKPFITDVQDLWPDALYATGFKRDGLLIKAIDRWCKLLYKNADKIVTLSEGFKAQIVSRGIDASKVHVVYNWCPEEPVIAKILQSPKSKHTYNNKLKLVYAGNIGAAQSLKTIIDAASKFPDSIDLLLYGGGLEKDELQSYVAVAAISNVTFGGYVPASEIFSKLVEADALVVHLKDEDLFKITIPSKTQSSMAMGKAILMAVGGEANNLVENALGGIVANPGNVDSIALAMEQLLDRRAELEKMGANSRAFYLDNLSTNSNYKKLDDVILKVGGSGVN